MKKSGFQDISLLKILSGPIKPKWSKKSHSWIPLTASSHIEDSHLLDHPGKKHI